MNAKVWSCVSLGSCIGGTIDWFIHVSIPYMQWLALAISIAAGLKAWFTSHRKGKR